MPGQRNTCRGTQGAGIKLFQILVNITHIDKQCQTSAASSTQKWCWKCQFKSAGDLEITTNGTTERVFGSQRIAFETANIPLSASVKMFLNAQAGVDLDDVHRVTGSSDGIIGIGDGLKFNQLIVIIIGITIANVTLDGKYQVAAQ